MPIPLNVLLVEDSQDDADLVLAELRRAGFEPNWKRVETEPDFLAELNNAPDIILSDFAMPQFNGLRAADLLRERELDIPFILISGTLGEERAVEAMKHGVTDYLLKDRTARLGNAVEGALSQKRLRDERKRLQQRLLLQSTAVETAANAILITDRGGSIRWVNPAFTRLTGYNVEEVLGKTPRVLKSGRHAEAFYKDLWQTIVSGQTWRGEFVNRRKDGSLFHDEHTITPVRSESGAITHFIGVMHDVTERNRIEKELHSTHAQLSQALEHSPAVIYTLKLGDERTSPTVVSENIKHLLGFTAEESRRLDWWESHLHPEDWERAFASIEETAKRGAVTLEYRLLDMKGRYVWVEDHRRVVKDSANRPVEIVGVWTDITDRKQVEEVLRESERRFRDMLENVELIAVTLDREGTVTFCNNYLLRLTGWQREDVIGVNWFSRFIPDDIPAVKKLFFDTIAVGKIPRHYETPIKTRTGELREIVWDNTMLQDAEGNILGTASLGQDVTESRQAEMALRESEEMNRGVLNSVLAHIAVLDGEGKIVAVNESWRRFARDNCGENETILARTDVGTNYLEICRTSRGQLSQEAKAAHDGIQAVLQGRKKTFMLEYPCHASDKERWFVLSVTPLRSSGTGAVVAHTDITQRKLAEAELRWNAAFLEAQVNSSLDGVLVVDQQGTTIFQNQRFNDLWKTPPEIAAEIGDQRRLDFATAQTKDPEAFLARVRHLYAHPDEISQDLVELKDGTMLDRYSSPVRGKDGHYYGRIWTFRDITEKKKLELQFLRNQRMESIGTLAGGVAHDLNNVLTPILMSVQMLREQCPDESSRELIDMLASSTQRGAAIVKQILSFARGVEGERTMVQLKHLIDDQDRICRDTFPKTVQVRTKVPKNLWTVMGDATQIHQVLMNLSVNARDAMPGGGRLTIAAENAMIDEQYARMNAQSRVGPHVLLCVSDTGTGIPPHIIEKIFDPFFTTKEVGKGTGLGLSTVLGIVRSHGGFVNVYSEPGKGTEFKVYLPADPEADMLKLGAEPVRPPGGNGELILVVDDEQSIRLITQATLETNGYRVLAAGDGTEAVASFAQNRDAVHAVITDMVMPYMDGPATIRALQRLQPNLKIIAVSGMMENAKQAEVAGTGHVTFLHKPYTAEKLLRTLHQVLAETNKG